MLPYFFRHYDDIVDQYFVFDNGSTDASLSMLQSHPRVKLSHFDVLGESFVEEECRLADTIWLQDRMANWVIITDIDEHIYHPDLLGYLRTCTGHGITAIRSIGYEMVSDAFPREQQQLCELVTTGLRSTGHDRLCAFNPAAITQTNFGPGRHVAKPQGRVIWPSRREVLLLHYKQLGIDYPIIRSAELRQGLRSRDIAQGWGRQYTWSAEEITAKWHQFKATAGPVPGLGSLRHIEPHRCVEEEHAIEVSGLLERDWYLAQNPDVECAAIDPLAHFCLYGWKEGRSPNFYFDGEWYRTHYPELCIPSRNPFYDYVTRGERANAWPSSRFDTGWYRNRYGLSVDESPLRHYIVHRSRGLVSPLPTFDVVEYCQNKPEVLSNAEDPFESYVNSELLKVPGNERGKIYD